MTQTYENKIKKETKKLKQINVKTKPQQKFRKTV